MTIYRSDKEKVWLEAAIQDLIDTAMLYRSCITCMHFVETTEVCNLAGARPPARIIATGCKEYLAEPPF